MAVSRVPVLGAGVAVRPQTAEPGLAAVASCALPAFPSAAPPAESGELFAVASGVPTADDTAAFTAETSDQVELGIVSSKSESIDFKVSERIRSAHSTDYPSRIRNLNWKHVRTSNFVNRHVTDPNDPM